MSSPLRVGVVGLGFMGAAHLKAWLQIPGIQIAAICNPSGRNLDGDLTRVGGNLSGQDGFRLDMTGVNALRDPVALFADPSIDIVDICTPTRTHVDLATAALKAKKHVVIEKPLARNVSGAKQLIHAAEAAGTCVMPAMCLRFWPAWVWLKNAIDSGAYGKVRAARFRRVAEAPAWGHEHFLRGSDSGGALLDLHVHDVDFAYWCFGRPQSVTAAGFPGPSGAIDHVVALHRLPSGIVLSIEGSWAMSPGFGFNSTYTVIFEHATADFDTARGPDALKLFAPGKPPEVVRPGDGDGYSGQLGYFANCVRQGTKPRTVTLEDALAAIEICEAEERSIALQSSVPL